MTNRKYVIVVGIDYSAASERALNEAFTLARTKHGAQLHVINVRAAPDEPVRDSGQAAPLPPLEYWTAELREYVARQAAAFEATARVAPLPHLYTHQGMNDPAQEIARLAANVDADLVIVGTHEWHGVPRALGSVAEAVTRLAPCPVLVVRRKGRPSFEAKGAPHHA
ncbi:MAG TPA: universal stress protein [Polyangiaceae bacterium]|nr:universal stress protein [Polyangiaceae bacterium]